MHCLEMHVKVRLPIALGFLMTSKSTQMYYKALRIREKLQEMVQKIKKEMNLATSLDLGELGFVGMNTPSV